MAREFEFKLNVEGLGDLNEANENTEELNERIDALNSNLRSLRHENEQLKTGKYKSDIDGITKAMLKMNTSFSSLTTTVKTLSTSMGKLMGMMSKGIVDVKKMGDVAATGAKATLKEYQVAMRTLGRLDNQDLITERQSDILGKRLAKVATGKMSMEEFIANTRKISKLYSEELNKRLDIASMGKSELAYEKNMADIKGKWSEKEQAGKAKAAAIERESLQKERQAQAVGAQKLKQEEEISRQKKIQTEEVKKQQSAKTAAETAKQGKAESLERTALLREEKYKEQIWAADVARQQKLEKNDRARLVLQEQMKAIVEGEYELEDKQAQKLALATSRLVDTARNIRNFAETEGLKGTVGAEATSMLRSQQFYKTIMDYAVGWKRVNSEEGKAADTFGRMIVDAKAMQAGINRIHTAFGQLASTVSAIRGIGTELRKTLTSIAQPVINMVTRLSSSAFKSSLEALKNIELSEIGFSNFFGASAVSGIMQNVKQEALLSPLSAAQVASYVNQIAPLSGGNSQLALNAAMGVAKMIQYSGGEVTTEMEYVVRNLRDVIAKGKATTIDVRQFNRAMPALKKVLQEMGLEDFLKDGEISISKETAPQLLEAFQKINEYEDVGTIFERTSETISGLMERLEEQIQLFVIDVGEFSGFTDLIKHTMHDFLEDSNGLLSDLRMRAQFIGRDIVAWLKSRDWERVLNIAKEVVNVLWTGLKESLEVLRRALGGTDWRETLINLASTIAAFVKGIANSYLWLLGIMNGLNKSGILGSGLVQGGMGILGFLSGNAGTLITGGLRGFGNFMGTLNQVTFTLIHSMEQHQAELLKASMTVSTFDEALMIAAQSLTTVSKDILLADEILGGVLTSEQRLMMQEQLVATQTEREALAKQANTVATKASEVAIESETAARAYNTASMRAQTAGNAGTGLLGPAAAGAGTKLGSILSGGLKAALMGIIVGQLSSSITQGLSEAFGADTYGAQNAGNIVGSVGGFAASGAMIGGMVGHPIIGGIIGGIVGAIKSAFESGGILDQARKDELDAFKQQVNSGEYLKEILNSIDHGNDISTNEFDNINSNLVSQMNQWAASTPSGTAQMLKDYLREIYINGKSIDDTVKEINKTQDQQAETLWKFVEADDIEGGNDYAAVLQNAGLSSYQIAAMIMQKSLEHGKSREETIDYLLKWGKTNNAAGEDLTSEMIAGMNDRDREATVDKLTQAWTEIGMESVQNLDMDEDTKIELARGLGKAMAKFLTGSIDEMEDSDWWYMNRLLSTAKVSNVSDQLGYSMSPSTMRAFLYDKNRAKYGVTLENAGLWGSNYKGHGAEDENGNPLGSSTYVFPDGMVESVTKGMSVQDAWQWPEDHYKDYGLNTKEVIEQWKAEMQAKMNEEQGIEQSMANKLEEINQKTGILVTRGVAVKLNRGDNLLDDGTSITLPTRGSMQKSRNKANGGLVYLAAGGSPRGVDIVPAMLQPGEYVVRRSAVEKVGLSAMDALNTGNLGYFARAIGRQNIYGDYNGSRTWNNTSNDNRAYKSNRVIVNNYTRGARLNRYYSLANRLS